VNPLSASVVPKDKDKINECRYCTRASVGFLCVLGVRIKKEKRANPLSASVASARNASSFPKDKEGLDLKVLCVPK